VRSGCAPSSLDSTIACGEWWITFSAAAICRDSERSATTSTTNTGTPGCSSANSDTSSAARALMGQRVLCL
jgi:hypothetical protein